MKQPGSSRPIAVVVGPGQHGDELTSAVERQGRAVWVARRWPHLEMGYSGRTRRSRLYDLARRAAWAGWRRIPVAGAIPVPKHAELATFDSIVAKHLPDSCLFVGWSQVALRSMQKARSRGTPVILEHPMVHVDTWTRALREECDRLGCRPRSSQAWFSDGLVQRMKAEYALADAISVPSSYAEDTFTHGGLDAGRLTCTPLGVDTSLFKPAVSRRVGSLRLLYVGRIDLLKGVQYLLEAVKRLYSKSTELVLAGHVQPEFRPVIEQASLPNVHLLGELPKTEIAALYQTADVMVFPTLVDAFGLVILEAMASGVPVVTTTSSGGPDIISDGHDGFLVQAGDTDALAAAIDRLLTDDALRLDMGRAARETAERFSWQRYAEAIGLVHGRVMGDSASPSRPREG